MSALTRNSSCIAEWAVLVQAPPSSFAYGAVADLNSFPSHTAILALAIAASIGVMMVFLACALPSFGNWSPLSVSMSHVWTESEPSA